MTQFKMLKKNFKDTWIRAGDLDVVWATAQRPLRKGKVKRIAAGFDDVKFGKVIVTEKHNGRHHVIDGQTRLAAFREVIGGGDQQVPCLVIRGITNPKEAAEAWIGFNGDGRTKPTPIELFHVSVTAEHPDAVAINKLIESLGFKVEQSVNTSAPTIAAISACEAVYRRAGIEGLRNVLGLLLSMWGTADSFAFSSYFILGMDKFLHLAGEDVDLKRLAMKASKSYTPARIVGAARGARDLQRGSMALNVARVLIVEYNKGLRSGSKIAMP